MPELDGLRSTATSTFHLVGLFAGFVAVLSFYDAVASAGLTGGLRKLVDGYRHLVLDPMGRFFDPALRAFLHELSQLTKIECRLPPHWKDLFVPAWFYFIKDASVNLRRGRKHYFYFLAAWGAIVALFFAVGLGNIDVNNEPVISLVVLTSAFTIYEIGSDIYHARFFRRESTMLEGFWFQFKVRALTNILIGAIVICVAWAIGGSVKYIAGLLLILYVLCLGFRDVALSFYLDYRNRRIYGIDVIGKIPQSGTWYLGSRIIVIIVVTVVAIIWNGA